MYSSCLQDHPRVCGENVTRLKTWQGAIGSPPRVRGKHRLAKFLGYEGRITPACAGKTFQLAGIEVVTRGSPPRVRGKQKCFTMQKIYGRITPACAGKTYCTVLFRKLCQDHPRVCGENNIIQITLLTKIGSPPRVRGKHFGNGVFPWLILVLSLDPL